MGKRAFLGLVVILALVAAACGSSGTDESGITSAASSTSSTAQSDTGGGGVGAEGIEVHGHWKLDILDADGTLDRTIEFENALVLAGAEKLAMILGRAWTTGAWGVSLAHQELNGASTDSPCLDESGAQAPCNLIELPDPLDRPNWFDTLSLETTPDNELVLDGTATMGRDGTITLVSTFVKVCTADVSSETCFTQTGVGPTSDLGFTSKLALLDPDDDFDAVSVTAGQLVQLIVTLSFS